MRVAFYAPLKPPDHGIPSGDRRMAVLLMEALSAAGHDVQLACRFRSREGAGDPHRQRRLEGVGRALGRRLAARYLSQPAELRPQLWFTYHLYYKAPDHLGPLVCDALGLPYVVAEPSFAAKRARGSFAVGHAAATAALARVDAAILLNGADEAGVAQIVPQERCHRLLPFLGPEAEPRPTRSAARARIAAEFDLDGRVPWLLTVAMMRAPDKLASYRRLAQAMLDMKIWKWQLVIVGDGPEREAVREAFVKLPRWRVRFAGLAAPPEVSRFYAAADLFVWPSVNEAYGMAILEAQAAGLPVVATAVGGVPEIVAHGETGLLAPPEHELEFLIHLERLVVDPGMRRRMGEAAAARAAARHGFGNAVAGLDAILAPLAPP